MRGRDRWEWAGRLIGGGLAPSSACGGAGWRRAGASGWHLPPSGSPPSVAKVGVVIGDLNSPTQRKRTPRIPHTVHGTVRHFESPTDALLL